MKKKKWIVGLALACMMTLPLAFAACGDIGDSNNGDDKGEESGIGGGIDDEDEGGSGSGGIDDEGGDEGGEEGVTAAVWDSEIDRVGSNFTFEAPYEDANTSETRYTLRDGVNLETYTLKGDVKSSVLRDIKDTVGYTEYTYSVKDEEWTKHYFKATDDAVQTTLGIYSDPLQGLKGHFDDFTYENGKYVCGEITLTVEGEPLEFESFEVVFEDNKLVSVTFERLGGVQFTFSKLGETHVVAPAEYDTEKAAESVDEFGNPKEKTDDTAA